MKLPMILCLFAYLFPAGIKAENNPPIQFQMFKVTDAGNRMHIQWQVANQSKCCYFEIEKSVENSSFRVIAVALPFENNSDSCYEYKERVTSSHNKKKTRYRIRYCDNFGNGFYSQTVAGNE